METNGAVFISIVKKVLKKHNGKIMIASDAQQLMQVGMLWKAYRRSMQTALRGFLRESLFYEERAR